MTPEQTRKKGPLSALRATLLPTCREMSGLSSRSQDGPLPLFQRIGFRFHLMMCSLCRRYRKQLRWLSKAADRPAAASPVSSRLSDSGRDRLKRELRQRTSTAAPAASQPRHPSEPHDHGHDHNC